MIGPNKLDPQDIILLDTIVKSLLPRFKSASIRCVPNSNISRADAALLDNALIDITESLTVILNHTSGLKITLNQPGIAKISGEGPTARMLKWMLGSDDHDYQELIKSSSISSVIEDEKRKNQDEDDLPF